MWQPRLADPTPWGWALLSALAAVLAAVLVAGARRGWRAWVWPALLLALLVTDRLIDLGLLAYVSGRHALRTFDVYGGRRPWQIGGSIALVAIVVVLAIAAVRARRSGRLGAAWWAVVASALVLIVIQAIRITSLHEIDAWMEMLLPFPGSPRLYQTLPMAPIIVALVAALAGGFGNKAPARIVEAPERPRAEPRPVDDRASRPHWVIRLVVLLLVLTAPEWAGRISRWVGPGPSPPSATEGDGR